MFAVNDMTFRGVGIESLKRGEQKEYKHDLIAEDGTRRSEPRARYRTYQVTFGSIMQSDYDALHSALASNAETLRITLPDGQKHITMDARVDISDDGIEFIEADGTLHWDGLTINITGITPLGEGQ